MSTNKTFQILYEVPPPFIIDSNFERVEQKVPETKRKLLFQVSPKTDLAELSKANSIESNLQNINSIDIASKKNLRLNLNEIHETKEILTPDKTTLGYLALPETIRRFEPFNDYRSTENVIQSQYFKRIGGISNGTGNMHEYPHDSYAFDSPENLYDDANQNGPFDETQFYENQANPFKQRYDSPQNPLRGRRMERDPFEDQKRYESTPRRGIFNRTNPHPRNPSSFLPKMHKPLWPWLIFLPLAFLFLEVFIFK